MMTYEVSNKTGCLCLYTPIFSVYGGCDYSGSLSDDLLQSIEFVRVTKLMLYFF